MQLKLARLDAYFKGDLSAHALAAVGTERRQGTRERPRSYATASLGTVRLFEPENR